MIGGKPQDTLPPDRINTRMAKLLTRQAEKSMSEIHCKVKLQNPPPYIWYLTDLWNMILNGGLGARPQSQC